MKIKTRKPKLNDIFQILEIVQDAKVMLKEQGNGQWQNGYPDASDFINDLNAKQLFIGLVEEKIVGVFSFVINDETYQNLPKVKFTGDKDYIVMHRICVRKEHLHQGIGVSLFKEFEKIARRMHIHSLRVDTHENNIPMTSLIKKMGYEKCGKAILPGNIERVIYEKLI